MTIYGVQTLALPNRVLDRIKVWKAGALALDDSSAPLVRGTVAVPITELSSLSDSSRLLSVSVRSDGDVDRLVLADGSAVQIPAGGYVDPSQLQIGEPIRVDGVGTPLANQKFIEAMDVLRPDQTSLISTRSGFGETWKSKIGTVRQVLLTPQGQVDGVLLTDRSAIRFYPVPGAQVSSLVPGTAVKAAGPQLANQLRTSLLLLTSKDRVVDLSYGREFRWPSSFAALSKQG